MFTVSVGFWRIAAYIFTSLYMCVQRSLQRNTNAFPLDHATCAPSALSSTALSRLSTPSALRLDLSSTSTQSGLERCDQSTSRLGGTYTHAACQLLLGVGQNGSLIHDRFHGSCCCARLTGVPLVWLLLLVAAHLQFPSFGFDCGPVPLFVHCILILWMSVCLWGYLWLWRPTFVHTYLSEVSLMLLSTILNEQQR